MIGGANEINLDYETSITPVPYGCQTRIMLYFLLYKGVQRNKNASRSINSKLEFDEEKLYGFAKKYRVSTDMDESEVIE